MVVLLATLINRCMVNVLCPGSGACLHMRKLNMTRSCAPRVVGIGGTIGGPSSTERALRIAVAAAGREGLETRVFGGAELARLPLYDPKAAERTREERAFVEAVRNASTLIIASPGY